VKRADISGKKEGISETKLEELEINDKIKNIRGLHRGINDFRKGYHFRKNIVKDGKGDLDPDSQCILVRWRKYFPQLLNVGGNIDVNNLYISQVPLSLS